MIAIIMGVSGAGKSTIGRELATALGAELVDGDDFHPPSNVAKMAAGQPLDDADRLPWLDSLRAAIDDWAAQGRDVVLACSALKRDYRRLLDGGRPEVVWIYLDVPRDVLEARLRGRKSHFMPAELLDSQLLALEPPRSDEAAIAVDASRGPLEVVRDIQRRLPDGSGGGKK